MEKKITEIKGDFKNIDFINHSYIYSLMESFSEIKDEQIDAVLEKAKKREKITPEDVMLLLASEKKEHLKKIFNIAGQIKKEIYGDRIVVFAPLYISNYCVNNCVYCGYRRDNKFSRRKLSMHEIQEEVKLLEKMGHKRLALEIGEDPVNCGMEYITDAIKTIYSTKSDNGAIRRINANIAATTVENYKKLKDADIGTYILFQETYHKPTYEKMHPDSLKGDYLYHLNAFSRAMEAGIDDVGAGVLFGLSDWRFEVLGLMLHNEYLEKNFGVGFHTISVPRMKKADGVSLQQFPNIIDDDVFKKIVAILRIAVPFTGLILSTRETAELRKEVLQYGVSQISAGSCTGVGGYKDESEGVESSQFEVGDHRSPLEILKELVDDGYIPSYCTACYRSGRTGDRFMQLAKSGNIQNVCQPNALMTLTEYAMDYGDAELKEKVFQVIEREIEKIAREDIRNYTRKSIEKIKTGERDFFI
ncbi:MAG: [FeFe] hydrogenase H-cluster radical SAM maturase HydG [Fusobacteriaceae bacterium]